MSAARRFVAYDCIVDSAIDIWGAQECPAVAGVEPDIRVTLGPTLAPCPDRDIYQWDGEHLDFQPPGVGRFRCRGGNAIEVTALPGADPDEIRALLIATALPALLWMRHAFVLHAAAVLLPGSSRAVAIAGPSGIGKSTILAQLIARGAVLIADDTLCLAAEGGTVSASGLPGGYFVRDPGSVERIFQPVPEAAQCRHAPLGAIFFVSRGTVATPEITRLSGVGTVEQLLANRHRPRAAEMLGRQVAVLQDCTKMAHDVPAYRWHRRNDAAAIAPAEWDALANSGSRA